MEEIPVQNQGGSVVLDIEALSQSSDKCSGSPKMTKALSRKGSYRMERRTGEDQETDDASKKFVVKVACSQLDQLKQPSVSNKALMTLTTTTGCACLTEGGEGKYKKPNRLTSINPRKILLFFASMSSMGTMILIYFTLAIKHRGGV